ncbi:MAG TPA: hypothetical protein PKX90_10370 [bacterium]|nr:hypothetical protein [bacterium]HPQ19656.1 hypothetical protein [bacterium]
MSEKRIIILLNIILIVISAFIIVNGINTIIKTKFNINTNISIISERIVNEEKIRNFPPEYYFLIEDFFSDNELTNDQSKETPKLLSDYKLQGVIIINETLSIAIIKDITNNLVYYLKRNEEIDGYKIKKILKNQVKMIKNKKEYTLEINDEPILRVSGRQSGLINEFNNSNYISHILSKTEFEKKIYNNLNQIFQTLTLVPNVNENNIMTGVRIANLVPGSLIYQYGARQGDIILRVNGHKIDSMEKGYKLWENVKNENYIEIEILRNNKPIIFAFEITK